MNKSTLYSITAALLFLSLITMMAFQYSEHYQQSERLSSVYQIFPVAIPSNLTFADETVPLDKYGIKERLDRELLVNTYWQSNTMLILKRSKKYFAVIEPILKKHGIPQDFKYLPIAESALQNVQSPAGANGVWQFMERSATYYNLEVSDEVDERLNLKLSTEAACLYLKEAHQEFGSWTLAAAAYNRGIGGMKSALNKQDVTSYYDLHLNHETSRYILRILAFKIILEHPDSYGFQLENKDYYASNKTREVQVDSSINDLAKYAKAKGTNYHILKSLNPWLKTNSLTLKAKQYTLNLPR